MARPHRDPLGLALSVGFVLVLYGPAVSGQGAFFQRDVWLYWIPNIEWAARALAAGHLPQWNPYIGFGAPFLADPSFQFFYPPTILTWILQPKAAYSVLVVGHSILGSLGAFTLLRPRLRSTSSALVGAIGFVAAGPLVSSANLWHHFSSAMYMPWVLDAFLRLRSGRGSVERLGFLTGMQALAGSADVCVMTAMGLAFLLPAGWRRLGRLIPKLGAAVLLCCLIAAVQWLPTKLLALKASRADLDIQTRLYWSVSPPSLIDFVLPLSGIAHATSWASNYAEERLRLIPWMYLGASTLPLLLLGAWRAPRGALLLFVSVLLSMGKYTPLAGLVEHIPVVSMFRFPSKLLWFVSAVWATLAAIGLQEFQRRSRRMNGSVLLVGVAVLGAGLSLMVLDSAATGDHEDWQQIRAVLSWAPLALGSVLVALGISGRALSAVAFIVAVDLVGQGRTYNAYASGEMLRTRPAMVDELHRQNAYRIFVLQKSRSESRYWKSPNLWSKEEAYYFGQAQFLLPPQSIRWSIKGSFDGDFTGLAPPDYSALSSVVGDGPSLNANLLRLAGVTHVLRFRGPDPPEFEVVAEVPTFHDRPALVLRVPDPLPPAYVVHTIQSVASSRAAIDALRNPSFDAARKIVRVEENSVGGLKAEAEPGGSTARIEYESDGQVVAKAHLTAPGTLVVLNAFSEGWRARVDGEPRPVRPANLLFQSVDLEAGEHIVDLDYQTPGLVAGFGLSVLAWAWMGLRLSGSRPAKKT